ncbi:MAG: hypothetical protein NC211_01045 [Alistipes senegalensis]|nr:hypothetical protein [Oxalobacter formigenes]MCM1280412.1 hypothetical protein [Alistipes senegalensis]
MQKRKAVVFSQTAAFPAYRLPTSAKTPDREKIDNANSFIYKKVSLTCDKSGKYNFIV